MTLVKHYEAAIARGDIHDDSQQRLVLLSMQRLKEEIERPKRSRFPWRKKAPLIGLYLYGPVGSGKTYLMDLFYQHLMLQQKARFHFHHFMQQVDSQLRRLQGQKDPLRRIAAELAKSTQILCLDEFLVLDVAHAMILAELLQSLFANGVILVTTSNTRPDDLYLNGVQRERFLPAIALIKTHCELLSLLDNKDYRLGKESLISAYLYPLDCKTQKDLMQQFSVLAQDSEEEGIIRIQNRDIPFIKCGGRVIWFDFKVICNLPRSQLDYLEIAERFDTIFVSDMPQLTRNDTIAAILLIHFIDVMYDRGIKLVISSAVPLEQLYVEGEMLSAFKRTLSRLQEMQSADYARRHLRFN